MSERQREELTPEEERENTKAIIAHVLPFALWLTLMVYFTDPKWGYTARSIGGFIVLLVFRPWRWYPKFNWKNLPAALGAGILIFIVWVGLETPWVAERPTAQ